MEPLVKGDNISYERRTCPLEVRSNTDGLIKLGGLGIPFERVSLDLGGFYEIITRDAVSISTINRSNPAALYGHDPNKPLGKAAAGTLRFWREESGIWYEFDLPIEISYARDLLVSVERGDISESSFGFRLDFSQDDPPTDWSATHNNLPLRRINTISEVFDFSPVVFPAYGNNTSVALRDLENKRSGAPPTVFAPYFKGLNFVKVNKLKKWTTGN